VRADAEKILSSHKKDQHKQTNKQKEQRQRRIIFNLENANKKSLPKKIFKRNPTKLICPEKRERMSKCR
jgi:hypothetical protein